MDLPNASSISLVPDETSQGRHEITIPQAHAILLADALMIARDNGVPLGKSTLQRWAKVWAETLDAPVKAVLQVTRDGRHYEIDRDDFEAWLLQQAENQQASRDLARPAETSQDPIRPQETPQGPVRSQEASSETPKEADWVRELENENMQLKIDVGARKQLLERAKDDMDDLRSMTDNLLRENGSLRFQLQQLPPPQAHKELQLPVDNATPDGPSAI